MRENALRIIDRRALSLSLSPLTAFPRTSGLYLGAHVDTFRHLSVVACSCEFQTSKAITIRFWLSSFVSEIWKIHFSSICLWSTMTTTMIIRTLLLRVVIIRNDHGLRQPRNSTDVGSTRERTDISEHVCRVVELHFRESLSSWDRMGRERFRILFPYDLRTRIIRSPPRTVNDIHSDTGDREPERTVSDLRFDKHVRVFAPNLR